jgi:metal-responsive CopG/Arc/MetJ family transcriptional regulator
MTEVRMKPMRTPERSRTGISLPVAVLDRVDEKRGFDTRSYFIAKALVWYLNHLENNETEDKNVKTTSSGASQVPRLESPVSTQLGGL